MRSEVSEIVYNPDFVYVRLFIIDRLIIVILFHRIVRIWCAAVYRARGVLEKNSWDLGELQTNKCKLHEVNVLFSNKEARSLRMKEDSFDAYIRMYACKNVFSCQYGNTVLEKNELSEEGKSILDVSRSLYVLHYADWWVM